MQLKLFSFFFAFTVNVLLLFVNWTEAVHFEELTASPPRMEPHTSPTLSRQLSGGSSPRQGSPTHQSSGGSSHAVWTGTAAEAQRVVKNHSKDKWNEGKDRTKSGLVQMWHGIKDGSTGLIKAASEGTGNGPSKTDIAIENSKKIGGGCKRLAKGVCNGLHSYVLNHQAKDPNKAMDEAADIVQRKAQQHGHRM